MKPRAAMGMGLAPERSWRTWTCVGLLAAAANLSLFLLMPNLLASRAPAALEFTTLIPQVNVIRMPRPDSQVARKSDPRPNEPPPAAQPRQMPSQAPLSRLSLPFEINPRLPAGPTTLALPPPETQIGSQALGMPDLFAVGELDQPLITLARMPPVYPLAAKRKGTEGWVTIRFVVNEQGLVEQVTITEARPPGIFDDSVRRCVSGWRFKPGTVQGRPVRVWAETTVRFELD